MNQLFLTANLLLINKLILFLSDQEYRQTTNIRRTLVSNIIADLSELLEHLLHDGAAPTTSSLSI